MGSSKSCNGWKWVEMSGNGSKLSEMGPEWIRNGSKLSEMGPEWIRNGSKLSEIRFRAYNFVQISPAYGPITRCNFGVYIFTVEMNHVKAQLMVSSVIGAKVFRMAIQFKHFSDKKEQLQMKCYKS